MEITGKIKVINETKTVSDKFKKREFVITTGETYPQDLLIQLSQAKCDLLDGHKVGDEVKVAINLMGRSLTSKEGEVKYFNTISGWKIEGDKNPSLTEAYFENSNPVNDLPF